MRDRSSAEDAVQEACLKAWRDLRALREPDRYDAWLRRLLVRTCLDHLRRQQRRPSEVELTHLHEARTNDHSRDIADREELERAFQRLSPVHRAVVVLAHYEELPMTQIADALHIPVGTVKSRLHRALGLLRADPDARMLSDAQLGQARLDEGASRGTARDRRWPVADHADRACKGLVSHIGNW